MKNRFVHLKVKIKSLAAEAKIIRAEEGKAKSDALRTSLLTHRTKHLRDIARTNLLAYGCVRGIPYKKIEGKTATEPDWDDIKSIVDRFGVVWDHVRESYDDYMKRKKQHEEVVAAWFVEAKEGLLLAA